jgi:hypothetical protein
MPIGKSDHGHGFDRTSPAEGVRALRAALEGETSVASAPDTARELLTGALARLEEDYDRALAFANEARAVTGKAAILASLRPSPAATEPPGAEPRRGKTRMPAKPRRPQVPRSRKR